MCSVHRLYARKSTGPASCGGGSERQFSMKLNSSISSTFSPVQESIRSPVSCPVPGRGRRAWVRPLYFLPELPASPAHLLLLRGAVIPYLLPETFLCFSDGPVRPRRPRPPSLSFRRRLDREAVYNALQELYDFYDEWENTCLQIVEKFQDFRSLIRCTYQCFRIPSVPAGQSV